ncbi:MAG: hypothetical protein Ct9H90mP20_1070 [Candidatus Neomarinimicrobiota bacterium]|nr:MAG: hypothetical protein Ct9H90mP20_1070 [Candidatus Neomarinimicrobiota bacterium]
MKLDIHPDYKEGTVTCSCGYSFKVFSTMGTKLLIFVPNATLFILEAKTSGYRR